LNRKTGRRKGLGVDEIEGRRTVDTARGLQIVVFDFDDDRDDDRDRDIDDDCACDDDCARDIDDDFDFADPRCATHFAADMDGLACGGLFDGG